MKWFLRILVFASILSGFSYTQLLLAALDPPKILRMLALEDYSTLDRFIIAQQKLQETGINNEKAIFFTLNTFQSSNVGLGEQLNRWVANNPNAYPAYLARSAHYAHIASLHRGERFIVDTAGLQRKKMTEYHILAIADIKKALSLNDKLLYGYSLLIRIARSSGTWADIAKISDAGLNVYPASYLIHRQILHKFQPKWGGYEGFTDRWLNTKIKPHLKKNPLLKTLFGYPDYLIADAFNTNKEYEKASFYYDQSIKKSSAEYNVIFLYDRALYLFYREEYKKALKDINQALLQYPYHVSSLELRGRILTNMQKPRKALRDLNLAISLDQSDPNILRARSYAYRKLEMYKAALNDAEASLEFGLYDNNNWRNKGFLLLYKMKDYKGAETAYQKALDIFKDDETTWYYLGAAQYNQFSCDFIKPMKVYLGMCKQAECDETYTKWSASVISMSIEKGYCQK